jgi:hypothetical protein
MTSKMASSPDSDSASLDATQKDTPVGELSQPVGIEDVFVEDGKAEDGKKKKKKRGNKRSAGAKKRGTGFEGETQ